MSPSGEVSTPSYPQTLHLVKFDREKNKRGGELPAAFVEVGDWTYPLVRGKSPVLKSDYGEWLCRYDKHSNFTHYSLERDVVLDFINLIINFLPLQESTAKMGNAIVDRTGGTILNTIN